jgi:hypothetical protein
MQNDIQQMHDRLKALNEQREYLSVHLKAVLKRTKIIEVDINLMKEKKNDNSVVDNFLRTASRNQQNSLYDRSASSTTTTHSNFLKKSTSSIQLLKQHRKNNNSLKKSAGSSSPMFREAIMADALLSNRPRTNGGIASRSIPRDDVSGMVLQLESLIKNRYSLYPFFVIVLFTFF